MSENVLIAAMQAAFEEAVKKAVAIHTEAMAVHIGTLAARIAALEGASWRPAAQVEALDNQEQFWAKVATFVQAENAKQAPSPADLVAEVDWSEQLDYGKIVEHISMGVLAGELTANQLEEIAEEIDLSDLANELDTDKLMKNFDLDQALRDWFSEQSFSIAP
jgi:hypothetical protein